MEIFCGKAEAETIAGDRSEVDVDHYLCIFDIFEAKWVWSSQLGLRIALAFWKEQSKRSKHYQVEDVFMS
jgi:hypothetical protein